MRIIAGEWKSRRIAPVPGRGVRPTTDRVREAWMSILATRIEGARVLDLFAGSGALGLEALSRGAAHVTFVERSHRAARTLQRNIRALGAGPDTTLVRGDAMTHLRSLEPFAYDLALADPPYDRGYTSQLAACYGVGPFTRELWVEHRVDEPFPPHAVAEQRRYGDTALTRVRQPGDEVG